MGSALTNQRIQSAARELARRPAGNQLLIRTNIADTVPILALDGKDIELLYLLILVAGQMRLSERSFSCQTIELLRA